MNYLFHDTDVVPVGEDDDGESVVDVPLELADLLGEILLLRVHNHQRAVLAGVEAGVGHTQHLHVEARGAEMHVHVLKRKLKKLQVTKITSPLKVEKSCKRNAIVR